MFDTANLATGVGLLVLFALCFYLIFGNLKKSTIYLIVGGMAALMFAALIAVRMLIPD